MNRFTRHVKKSLSLMTACALLMITGCAHKPEGADKVRNKLSQLQSSTELANRAAVEIKEAENAVRAAEQPQRDKEIGQQLVFVADHKVDIAAMQAQSRLLEDQRKALIEERDKARLDSRTREADIAHSQTESLQQQLADLDAKMTNRGVVVTLGDVLFDTGKAELKSGAADRLNKLAAFLNQYQDRTVIIEGHTDSVGNEDFNFSLSQHRADAVKSYLVGQNVDPSRISSSGKGETSPIASNKSASGRQLNRRVEVIISMPPPK